MRPSLPSTPECIISVILLVGHEPLPWLCSLHGEGLALWRWQALPTLLSMHSEPRLREGAAPRRQRFCLPSGARQEAYVLITRGVPPTGRAKALASVAARCGRPHLARGVSPARQGAFCLWTNLHSTARTRGSLLWLPSAWAASVALARIPEALSLPTFKIPHWGALSGTSPSCSQWAVPLVPSSLKEINSRTFEATISLLMSLCLSPAFCFYLLLRLFSVMNEYSLSATSIAG